MTRSECSPNVDHHVRFVGMGKKITFVRFLILAAATFSVACASHKSSAQYKVHVGMDKSDVLDAMGTPARKTRVSGLDRWTYNSAPGSTSALYVFFSDGKVTYVGPESTLPEFKPADGSKFNPVGE